MRSLTYDPTANSGQGGFWASSWATDITQFDMSGNTITTIPAGSHLLTGMYGTAFDNLSFGGPYLWVFDQGSSPSNSDIVQIKISTQMQTGVIHNVMSDVGVAASDTSGLAGGLFFYTTSPNTLTLAGVLQGGPTNRLFAYDEGLSGLAENPNTDGFVSVFPNPVRDMMNVHIEKQNNDEIQLQIIDAIGRIIFNKTTRGLNNYINLSKYEAGLYFVKVTYHNINYHSKFIKQ